MQDTDFFLSIGCMCGCLVGILMGSYLYRAFRLSEEGDAGDAEHRQSQNEEENAFELLQGMNLLIL